MTSLHIRKENKARSAANRATHEEKRQHRVDIISKYAGYLTSRQIAEMLDCTPESVRNLACEFGISLAVNRSSKLTEEDYALIYQLEAENIDDATIMAKFECSAAELRRARKSYQKAPEGAFLLKAAGKLQQ